MTSQALDILHIAFREDDPEATSHYLQAAFAREEAHRIHYGEDQFGIVFTTPRPTIERKQTKYMKFRSAVDTLLTPRAVRVIENPLSLEESAALEVAVTDACAELNLPSGIIYYAGTLSAQDAYESLTRNQEATIPVNK